MADPSLSCPLTPGHLHVWFDMKQPEVTVQTTAFNNVTTSNDTMLFRDFIRNVTQHLVKQTWLMMMSLGGRWVTD